MAIFYHYLFFFAPEALFKNKRDVELVGLFTLTYIHGINHLWLYFELAFYRHDFNLQDMKGKMM